MLSEHVGAISSALLSRRLHHQLLTDAECLMGAQRAQVLLPGVRAGPEEHAPSHVSNVQGAH